LRPSLSLRLFLRRVGMLVCPPHQGKRMKRGWDLVLGAAILAGALALRWADPLPLQQLRNLTFDTYQRLQPRAYDPTLPVTIAAIDEKALDAFGQWPWPRSTLARIADRLTDLGAAAIAFDVLFAEPDRTSPAAIAADLPADAQYNAARAQLGRSEERRVGRECRSRCASIED